MEEKKRRRKADIILISAIVAAGLLLGLVLLLSQKKGRIVQIRVSGEVVQTLSLDEDAKVQITGANGGNNLLIIQDGQAWVEEADCPDGLCRNMGKISRNGQSVVCLPHEVVVEITEGTEAENSDGVDIIVQ